MSNLTVPADFLVNVIPGVLAAGGNAPMMSGVCLTTSTRVPISPLGSVLSFPNAAAVGAFFGLNSNEFTEAGIYFAGYTGRTQVPSAMLFSQYPLTSVSAYLRGGNAAGLTQAQWQAITGSVSIVMDGYTYTTASVNFSTQTSLSGVAATLQTELNAAEPSVATVTASVGASFTGSGSSTNLTVTAVTGLISVGDKITGTGVPANTTIVSQTSGTTGGAGVYVTSQATTASSASITSTSNVLNVTAVASGTVAVGQVITGGGLTAATITALGTGTGAVGTYVFGGAQQSQTSVTVTCSGPAITVTFDSTSGGFVITSGDTGNASTAAFATGTAAAALFLTAATGAVVSQGAAATTPAAFMTALTGNTTNFASFFTAFDPDGGSGNTQKKAFATWNGTQNDQFVYLGWDTDITPTESTNASSSFGQWLLTNKPSGTMAIYEPTNLHIAAFVSGTIASINFNATNGRITLAARSQAGLTPAVTNGTVYANLLANGYNTYAIFSTKSQSFNYFEPGSISGPFQWANTYVNQIWLNSELQTALMLGLGQIGSAPFNAAGDAIIRSFCLDPVNAFVNFGGARPGVTLSAAQIEEINTAAGNQTAATSVATAGYYLQVVPSSPQVRQSRGPKLVNLWYEDGGDVQTISVSSVAVQ